MAHSISREWRWAGASRGERCLPEEPIPSPDIPSLLIVPIHLVIRPYNLYFQQLNWLSKARIFKALLFNNLLTLSFNCFSPSALNP